ncbi:MAG: hypothetical protein PQJ45_01930 [Sphaerochaetaceae bacterium]|nr:hypothetical protein [Sphaerochaetaceae bacterium]
MKKIFLIITLFILSTTSIFAIEVGSKIDTGLYYYPTITLNDSDDLEVYSSLSSTIDFELFYLKFKRDEIGPYFSLFNVSRSIVYNNIYLRKFNATAIGLDWGHYFSNNFKFNTKVAMGVGTVGESTNKEMYIDLSLVPSMILINKKDFDLNLNYIFNGVYRNSLFSPSVGIGIAMSFDWITDSSELLETKSQNYKAKGIL